MTEEKVNINGQLLDFNQLQVEYIHLEGKYKILQSGYRSCEKSEQKYRKALEEIREELCKGRTFYEGYFDNENLSRTDKAIKKINEVLND